MMNFIESLFGDVIERYMKYDYCLFYRFYDGITEEDMEQQKLINNWIERLDKEKQHNPNMSISEFINKEFDKKRGKELFQIYSEYSEIIKDGYNDVLRRAKEYFIRNFEYIGDKDSKTTVDRYLNRVNELMEQISGLEKDQINKIFGNEAVIYNGFDRISNYGKILDIEKFNELIKLKREYDTLIKKFNHFVTENIYDKIINISNETFDNPVKNQINNLSERFKLTDEEKTFIAFLLRYSIKNIRFCSIYNDYKNRLVQYAENKIIDKKLEKIRKKIDDKKFKDKYSILKDIELKKTEEEISKLIPIKPNVFIKFLPELIHYDGYSYCNIRQDCCLEFYLEYVKDNEGNVIETILKVFLDTYNVASGGKFRPITERYKCDNIERHKILGYIYTGNYNIDYLIKHSKQIRNVIFPLNNKFINSDTYKTCELIESLKKLSKECCLKINHIHCDIEIAKMNCLNSKSNTPNNNKPNINTLNTDTLCKVFEMEVFEHKAHNGDCDKMIYFEDFNDNKGKRLFKVTNLYNYISNLRKPIIEECKIRLGDEAFLIERVKNSSKTNKDKLKLIEKINSDKPLKGADKLFLENEIRSDIIRRTNETINKTNLLPDSYLSQEFMTYCKYEKPSKEDKINLNAINKMNESSLGEFVKMNHLDWANLDLTTKLTLIEIMNSAKLDEEFKNNIIDEIKKINESYFNDFNESNDKVLNKLNRLLPESSQLKPKFNKISKELLIQLVEKNNLKELSKYKSFFSEYMKKTPENKLFISLYDIFWIRNFQQVWFIESIATNIFEDKEMWNKYFTSILDPNDLKHCSIFDFRELFEENVKKRKGIYETHTPDIPRISGVIVRNEEREKAVLKAVVMHHTFREIMKNVHRYGNETQPYRCLDGIDLKVPYRSTTGILRDLRGAAEEMDKELQLGLKMIK